VRPRLVVAGQTSVMSFPLVLSIIIVNWNVCDLLRDCLRSLYQQMRMPANCWELILVDNHSEDGSVEMLREEFPGAILMVNSENLGFAKANNQAFRICRGRYVLLLNPDTVILDHAVDRMMEILEARPDVAALGCPLLNPDRSLQQRWTGGSQPGLLNLTCHFLLPYRLLSASILSKPLCLEKEPVNDKEVGWVSGACMLLRREALGEQIFDERFFLYGEDLELCNRLVHAGWKVIYTPRAQVVHHGGRATERQTSEVQLSRLRNLREIFAMRNGRRSLLLFDFLLSVGYLARSLGYGVAAFTRPGKGFGERAASCRLFTAEAVRLLVRR